MASLRVDALVSMSAPRFPKLLRIVCHELKDCAGDYELIPRVAGNQPVWKLVKGDRWLYSSILGQWCVGGPSAEQSDFDSSVGFLCHPAMHLGKMPHMMDGQWQIHDGNTWVAAPNITVREVEDVQRGQNDYPKVLRISSPARTDCAGDYNLIDNMSGGLPVWKLVGGERWLYSSSIGQWLVGGPQAAEVDFRTDLGFLSQLLYHRGMMPDVVQDSWLLFNGSDWVCDPTITVTDMDATNGSENRIAKIEKYAEKVADTPSKSCCWTPWRPCKAG